MGADGNAEYPTSTQLTEQNTQQRSWTRTSVESVETLFNNGGTYLHARVGSASRKSRTTWPAVEHSVRNRTRQFSTYEHMTAEAVRVLLRCTMDRRYHEMSYLRASTNSYPGSHLPIAQHGS